MINIAIYNIESGLIRQRTICPSEQVLSQLFVGEDFYLNCPSDATHIKENTPIKLPRELSYEEIKNKLEASVQAHLDSTAKINGNWDSMLSARAAAAITGPFQTQAISLAEWWSAVWDCCYQILADVTEGLRPIPTKEELINELPQYQG